MEMQVLLKSDRERIPAAGVSWVRETWDPDPHPVRIRSLVLRFEMNRA